MNTPHSLFDFKTIKVHLLLKTRSLKVEIQNSYFDSQMLDDFEQLFDWLAAHCEVNAVIIQGHNPKYLLKDFCPDEFISLSDSEHYHFLERFSSVVKAMFYLPQTIIMDLAENAQALALEFSLGADIKIASKNCSAYYCWTHKGRVHASGGLSLASQLYGHSLVRFWTQSSRSIAKEQIIASGLIHQFYSDREQCLSEHLNDIIQQAPIARIQNKRALLDQLSPILEENSFTETEFSIAALGQRDWHQYLISQKEVRSVQFQSAKSLAYRLKENKKRGHLKQVNEH